MVQNTPQTFQKTIQWVAPAAHAIAVDIADVDSPIDTLGFHYAYIVANTGVITTAAWVIQVEASATSAGTYADVTGALFTITGNAAQYQSGVIDLFGTLLNKNRFLQLNGVSATAVANLGIIIQLFAPRDQSEYIVTADDPIFSV